MKKLLFILAFVCAGLGWVDRAHAQSSKFTATETGVGPVRIGAAMAELPTSYTGLYDAIDIDEYGTIVFMLGDKVVMTAQCGDGRIYMIAVMSPNIAFKGLAPGTSVRKALAAGGVVYASLYPFLKLDYYSNGTYFGVFFEIPEEGLSESGRARLDRSLETNNAEKCTADDFKADATLGTMYIEIYDDEEAIP